MQDQIKELKERNTELEMNNLDNNDRVSDVTNLMKIDIRDLLKDLNA